MNHAVLSPLRRGWERVDVDLNDSETAGFFALLYLGEMIVKLATVAFCSGLQPDPENRSYAAAQRLVRASGVGEHASVLSEILTGPTYQSLHPAVRPLQSEIVSKAAADSWQLKAGALLSSVLSELGYTSSRTTGSSALLGWFHDFSVLRNKTRGHGAPPTSVIITVFPQLRESLKLVSDNLSIFKLPWAYTRRNLSGKYRVTTIGGDPAAQPLVELKSSDRRQIPDGVQFAIDESIFHVRFLLTDSDLSDYLLPNGSFSNGHCEFLSLITGNLRDYDASDFTKPAEGLPGSETDGRPQLEALGDTFTNIPARPIDYISRPTLEGTLLRLLKLDGRHEIITLAGPGGAGKTSLALEVCHRIASEESGRFELMIWFSGRDIDLLPTGPKTVRPQGITIKDFAKTYCALVSPAESGLRGFRPEEYLARELKHQSIGSALYIFDNFETVADQLEMFEWIDTHIRSPNKALITTRTRDFSGDKSIPVTGMTDDEARNLVESVCKALAIADLLRPEQVDELIRESGGHPYVIRILLGEMALQNRYIKPERVVADQERLLNALFERTYSRLSPTAQLIFLLLSSWRSAVPSTALEAAVLHHAPERLQVEDAVSELVRLSLIEEVNSQDKSIRFLNAPLAASAFGRTKISTNSNRALIQECLETLQLFGATHVRGTTTSAEKVIGRFINAVQRKIESKAETLVDALPILEYLASATPSCWKDLEALVDSVSPEDTDLRAKYLRRYIEADPVSLGSAQAWRGLARLLQRAGDTEGEILALGEVGRHLHSNIKEVSDAANGLNTALRNRSIDGSSLSNTAKREAIGWVIKRLRDAYNSLSATDLSRLAWLYLNTGNEIEARKIAQEGLNRQPDNDYCMRLLDRLQ